MQTLATQNRLVLTYGRFDGFDQTHIEFLRLAARLGGELVVGCATDAYAAQTGQPCTQPFEVRRDLLEKCRYVARVIPETSAQQKRTDIVNYNAGLLVMGVADQGRFAHLEDITQIQYLPRGSVISEAQDQRLYSRQLAVLG